MRKKLSEMSLAELWQLFPIYLTEHRDCWKDWYAAEETLLRKALATERGIRLSHIGSTAVVAIWAKPIVDILLEVPEDCDFIFLKKTLIHAGYNCMSEQLRRMSFNKGYTEKGFAEKVFHLHLRCLGDHDELYFRDYLNAHPDTAKKYETLKLKLWKQYAHDRDGYTAQKSEFVAAVTAKPKQPLKVGIRMKNNENDVFELQDSIFANDERSLFALTIDEGALLLCTE